MVGSLYDAIEKDYGAIATRLYRAFKPKPGKTKFLKCLCAAYVIIILFLYTVKTSSWKWRKLCCLPYVVIFEFTFLCLLLGTCALTVFLINLNLYGKDGLVIFLNNGNL